MKKRLTRIAPLKCGIVLGTLYAGLSLIMVPFFLLAGLVGAQAGETYTPLNGQASHSLPFPFFGLFALFLPFIYGFVGFLGGVIMAAIYNLVVRLTGGLEVTVEDVRPDFS
jgi:Ca2+/Na+ antiporter